MAISPTNEPILLGSAKALSVALDERDHYTQTHCDRVVALSLQLGVQCGLSNSELTHLRITAQFHDIGKIGVPDDVLLKPSRLTAEEWVLMKAHSQQGERIFRAAEIPALDDIAPMIRHHHESFDGSGYPDGLKGEEIPVICRVLLIVDGYDAMGTARPYHEPRSHSKIMEILRSESGKKTDPFIFGKFESLIETSSLRVQ